MCDTSRKAANIAKTSKSPCIFSLDGSLVAVTDIQARVRIYEIASHRELAKWTVRRKDDVPASRPARIFTSLKEIDSLVGIAGSKSTSGA